MTTPYYADESVTLWHGDCLEITDWLQADVLVTDPPYGLDAHLSGGRRGRTPASGFARVNGKPAWDVNLEARNDALAAWGDRPAAVFGSPRRLDDPPPFREIPLVWDKQVVGQGDVSFPWGRSYELIYVSGAGWTGRREESVLRVGHHVARKASLEGHPSFKPTGLLVKIIDKAPPGVVADPFAGSGSTLVAARNLGRRAIGVEIEERYCEIIAKRLSQGVLL